MKTGTKNLFLLPVLTTALGLILTGRVTAQIFTTLHSFREGPTNSSGVYTNSDGAYPFAALILFGNTLYGTASGGGTSGNGTVFAVSTNGTGFTNLHSFTGPRFTGSTITNTDGANPVAGLVLSGNTLYGTANRGGSWGNGTLFAINTNGTGFTNLHSFTALSIGPPYPQTNSDGESPQAGLIISGNTLYGTAAYGGSSGSGTVFAVNTNGTGFTTVYSFTGGSDAGSPYGRLTLSGKTLYGSTMYGGSSGYGTVFVVSTDGVSFTNLHSFTSLVLDSSSPTGAFTNSDGACPVAGLILSGSAVYGTAYLGGNSGLGTVFSLSFLPQLTITFSGTHVALSWPTNYAGLDYTGFTLQSTTNLLSTIWTTNSPAPIVVNGQNTVTNPISGTQQFFRLSR